MHKIKVPLKSRVSIICYYGLKDLSKISNVVMHSIQYKHNVPSFVIDTQAFEMLQRWASKIPIELCVKYHFKCFFNNTYLKILFFSNLKTQNRKIKFKFE